MNSKITILYAIVLDIRGKTSKKILLITMGNQLFWKELQSQRRLENVIALRKTLKASDVWLMSAR